MKGVNNTDRDLEKDLLRQDQTLQHVKDVNLVESLDTFKEGELEALLGQKMGLAPLQTWLGSEYILKRMKAQVSMVVHSKSAIILQVESADLMTKFSLDVRTNLEEENQCLLDHKWLENRGE